ncbi:MAG TPA: hypothetical protein VMF86_13145 [Stellaceae bacterium]|nr:hypothetical protein [Stellaceae bacterium]
MNSAALAGNASIRGGGDMSMSENNSDEAAPARGIDKPRLDCAVAAA